VRIHTDLPSYSFGIEIDKCGNKDIERSHKMTLAHKALNSDMWNKHNKNENQYTIESHLSDLEGS
jgi:hypothetical protein